MIFIYVFYLDVFVGQNFFLNLLALSLTFLIQKSAARFWRLPGAALLGALFQAVAVVFLPYALSVLANACLIVPVMLLLAFGRRLFVRRLAICLLSIVVLNGIATALYNLTGVGALRWYGMAAALLAACVLLRAGKRAVCRSMRQEKVLLFHGNRCVSCTGLYDSGNLLRMPVSMEPVHIVDGALLAPLVGTESGRTIGCRTLGEADGTITVYRLDAMERGGELWRGVWVGSADAALFAGKEYRVILNAACGAKRSRAGSI